MDEDARFEKNESSIAPETNDTSSNDLEIYSRNQITTAALIGGPIAGAYLAYVNLKKLNKTKESISMLIIGMVICATLVAMIFLLPDEMNFMGINLAVAIIIRTIAMQFLKPEITIHFKIGRKKERWLKALKVSLIIAAAYASVIFGIGFAINRI
jgi:hypothetical protein